MATIKATFVDDSGKQEIRRFPLDSNTAIKFGNLKAKLQQIFSQSLRGDFAVQWKDEEGDSITVSSDEELLTALNASKGSLFRVYIKEVASEKAKAAPKEDIPTPVLHPNVTCDGCNGDVFGFRYKCMECPDYDLCFACEGKGRHAQHVMLRLPAPSEVGAGIATFMPWFLGRHGRHGRHNWRHSSSFPRCHRRRHGRHGNGSDEDSKSGNEKGEETAHHGGKPNYPFQFQQVLEKIWTVLGGLPKEQGKRVKVYGKRGLPTHVHEDCSLVTCWAASQDGNYNSSGGAACPGYDKESKNYYVPPAADEFLKSVGDTVAAILDPLGIDVDVDVEHHGVRQHCGANSGNQKQDMPAEPQVNKETFKKAEDVVAAASDKNGSNGNSSPPVQPQPEVKSIHSVPAPEEVIPAPSVPVEAKPTAAFIKEGSPNGNPYETAALLVKNVIDRETGDWTYIEDKEKEQIPTAPVPPHPTPIQPILENQASAPQLPTSLLDEPIKEEVQHPNPTVQSALNQMLSMGFTNDGGWLTQLLEVKNGDINNVLEVLAPVNRSKKF